MVFAVPFCLWLSNWFLIPRRACLLPFPCYYASHTCLPYLFLFTDVTLALYLLPRRPPLFSTQVFFPSVCLCLPVLMPFFSTPHTLFAAHRCLAWPSARFTGWCVTTTQRLPAAFYAAAFVRIVVWAAPPSIRYSPSKRHLAACSLCDIPGLRRGGFGLQPSSPRFSVPTPI